MKAFYIICGILFWIWCSIVFGQHNADIWIIGGFVIFAIILVMTLSFCKKTSSPPNSTVVADFQAIRHQFDLLLQTMPTKDPLLIFRIKQIDTIITQLNSGAEYTDEMSKNLTRLSLELEFYIKSIEVMN